MVQNLIQKLQKRGALAWVYFVELSLFTALLISAYTHKMPIHEIIIPLSHPPAPLGSIFTALLVPGCILSMGSFPETAAGNQAYCFCSKPVRMCELECRFPLPMQNKFFWYLCLTFDDFRGNSICRFIVVKF